MLALLAAIILAICAYFGIAAATGSTIIGLIAGIIVFLAINGGNYLHGRGSRL